MKAMTSEMFSAEQVTEIRKISKRRELKWWAIGFVVAFASITLQEIFRKKLQQQLGTYEEASQLSPEAEKELKQLLDDGAALLAEGRDHEVFTRPDQDG